MPPKVSAGASAKPTKAKADKAATAKSEDSLNPETKLMWAVLCELSKDGKMTGVNWEDVKGQIEASTAHATRQRWDALKKRMATRGLEMPTSRTPAEAKAKVVKPKVAKAPKGTTKKPRGKKAKVAEEEGTNEEGENGEEVEEGEGSAGDAEEVQEGSGGEDAENEST